MEGGMKGRSPFKTYTSPSPLGEKDTKRGVRGASPLSKMLPLAKGKGIKGIGL